MARFFDPMNLGTIATLFCGWIITYAAWLTSIVFCASNHLRPLLVASAAVYPVGVVHGIGVWFGGW